MGEGRLEVESLGLFAGGASDVLGGGRPQLRKDRIYGANAGQHASIN